jgi:hypothetical protein
VYRLLLLSDRHVLTTKSLLRLNQGQSKKLKDIVEILYDELSSDIFRTALSKHINVMELRKSFILLLYVNSSPIALSSLFEVQSCRIPIVSSHNLV